MRVLLNEYCGPAWADAEVEMTGGVTKFFTITQIYSSEDPLGYHIFEVGARYIEQVGWYESNEYHSAVTKL